MLACSGSDGAAGPAGPAGKDGPPGGNGTSNPSVSGVVPARAFLARKLDVTLSGFGTAWTKDAKVDFGGADITVTGVSAASPTAIIASITISNTATVGPRDVTITEGNNKVVYTGGFKVEAPLAVSTVGTVAQGSIIQIHAKDKDVANPLDTTQTGDGLFSPIVFTNLAAKVGGVDAQVASATNFGADIIFLADVNAPAATDVTLSSGPPGGKDNVEFPLPKALTLTARTAAPLTAGTPTKGTISEAYGSALYQYTPPAAQNILDFAVTATGSTSTGGKAKPSIALLPKSGKFAELIGLGAAKTLATAAADPFYAVYWDNSGATGEHTVGVTATAATGLAWATANVSKATAQVATGLPFVLSGASLAGANSEAWVQYTTAVGDVGKKFHVQTVGGDWRTDTVVDVLATDGTTSLGGPSKDTDYHENFTSTAITFAGIHYIRVFASSMFDPAHKDYQLIVRLVP